MDVPTLVSVLVSALVAGLVSSWIGRPGRSLRLGKLEIVDANGNTRSCLETAGGGVALTLCEPSGATRIRMAVDAGDDPEVVLSDAKGRPRLSLSVRQMLDEIDLSSEQLKGMTRFEVGRYVRENAPYRPGIYCYNESGETGSAVTTDLIVLYGGGNVPVVNLSSRQEPYPGIVIQNPTENASVVIGILPPGESTIQLWQGDDLVCSWPRDESGQGRRSSETPE